MFAFISNIFFEQTKTTIMNTTIAADAVASQCWLFSVGKRKKK
jgi:hypothetical protein